MNTLILESNFLKQIEAEGAAAYPNECCGIMFGRDVPDSQGGNRIVERLMPVKNDFEVGEQFHRFSISGKQLMDAEKNASLHGQMVLGFYHSHPDHPAKPSEYDRQHAWPFYSYVIVAITKGQATDMTSWLLHEETATFSRQNIVKAHGETNAPTQRNLGEPLEGAGRCEFAIDAHIPMEPIRNEFPRPQPWAQYRRKAHSIFIPLLFVDWSIQWCAYFLSRWSLMEVLEYAGRFSILVAVIFYFCESGQRAEMRHYQAWQVINTAQGKGGSGGRIEAMSELNDDHVPLVAVDVSGAALQGVRLNKADLHRAFFKAADLRDAHLNAANLQFADFTNANLRNADLRGADLEDADLSLTDLTGANLSGANLRKAKLADADLTDADFSDVRNWQEIESIDLLQLDHLRGALAGFAEWARGHMAQRSATTATSQPADTK